MQDRLAAAMQRLRETGYAAGETGSAPSRSTAWYSEWLSLNIHLPCLVLDGIYRISSEGAAVFQQARAPSIEALQALLKKIITRPMRLLTRQGLLIEEQGMRYLAEIEADWIAAGFVGGRDELIDAARRRIGALTS